MAEDLDKEVVVGHVLGFKFVAADGSVSAAETAWFSGLVQAAENHEVRDQARLTGPCASFRPVLIYPLPAQGSPLELRPLFVGISQIHLFLKTYFVPRTGGSAPFIMFTRTLAILCSPFRRKISAFVISIQPTPEALITS